VASLSQIHLVGDAYDLSQPNTLQMVSLFDHPAYLRKACTALRLASPQGETLEVRKDTSREISDRPRLVLEGAIAPRLTDPTTVKERLQILQKSQVLLVE
jgi:hypothetical protein